ncbi:MAG TPA: phosphopantetheine-binding protein [Steroidobacteraceae bacterium]|nr:phosphopantetheine-binding protein [Steroidobacteraceae bacterium]
MNTKNTGGSGDVKETLRHFVTRSINFPDLGDDDDLFESGLVNSLFAIQLMTFIEKTFGVEVDADDLDIKNFRSIDAAADFVLKKNLAATTS